MVFSRQETKDSLSGWSLLDDILTVREVASRLKLAERTIYAMLNDRELPGFKVRGQWRVRRSDFERWLVAMATRSIDQAPEPEEAGVDTVLLEDQRAPAPSSAPLSGQCLAVDPLTERLPQTDLHRRFVDALGGRVHSHSPLARKPLELNLAVPLPGRVRVYLYNATRPPGGRPLGEHKVQLMVPGQRRGDRGSFDHGDGRIVLLVGHAAEEDVFVLWDAGLYGDFAWSRNVQVKAETIVEATAGKIAVQERRLRPSGGPPTTETVLACPSERLVDAVVQRVEITRRRMAEG